MNSNNSPWTVKEVNVAVELKKKIFPVKLDDTAYEESILFDLAGLDYMEHQQNSFEIGALKLLSAFGIKNGLSHLHGEEDTKDEVDNKVQIVSKERRISSTLEKIRYEINTRGFDVFISCKSQDYLRVHEVYNYLKQNGYKPFLADTSIKEVGIDQYTALIGEVIGICHSMIVFATDSKYIESPYVMAEWHSFVNDINTGHKPNAKLLTILSPEINIHELPLWLRDKQSFTTDDYKDSLIQFLK